MHQVHQKKEDRVDGYLVHAIRWSKRNWRTIGHIDRQIALAFFHLVSKLLGEGY